jgi:CDP-diacylglycerol--glycerol-3-phosphate 3-phosphatidyltransferase
MTIPTALTLLRMVLTFVIMALLFAPGWVAKAAALAGFVIAGATDWLDGWLARRWGQATPLGALLDPIADKVLVLGTLLALVQLRIVPAWMVLVIALREFLITGVRLVAASRRIVLAAAKEGKHKTVSQIATIVIILAVLTVDAAMGSHPRWPKPALDGLILGSLWVTMLLTVASGVSFFRRHLGVLRDAVASQESSRRGA